LAAPPSYQRIEAIRTPAEGGHIGEASGHRNILEEVNFHVAVSEIGVRIFCDIFRQACSDRRLSHRDVLPTLSARFVPLRFSIVGVDTFAGG
jgi:hypothetical protein